MVGGTLPKSLAGSAALTLDRIESFGLNGGDEVKAKSEAVLQKFYSQYKDPVAKTALETLNAIKTVAQPRPARVPGRPRSTRTAGWPRRSRPPRS